MSDVIRNVSEIDSADRQAMEHLLGQPLRENQQLIIRVVTVKTERAAAEEPPRGRSGGVALPDWCNVYEGLSDEEIADLERTVLTRADLSRPSE